MPLGYFGSPVPYSVSHLTGPYANHSSIIASNYSRPPTFTKSLPRLRSGFSPHLTTITESHHGTRPLVRITSPKVSIHVSPKFQMPRPIPINTADIDVSVNKYRKFDRASRSPKTSESDRSTPDTDRIELKSLDIGDNLSRSPIKRDRAVVRLHTIHKKNSREKRGPLKSWRDQVNLDDIQKVEKREEKSPGEKLIEKHLIKDRSEQKLQEINKKCENSTEEEPQRTFHQICKSISSDAISDDLNPGQPADIKRKQSRQLSTDDILKKIRRNSAEILHEQVLLLDQLLQQENLDKEDNGEVNGELQTNHTEGVKRKKKITRKKPVEEKENVEMKSTLQRRMTQKKIRRNSLEPPENLQIINPEVEKAYQNAIRDISQVEVEQIKIKPKPIITTSVNFDQPQQNLKAVIDEVQVEIELPKKEKKKFILNFTVQEIADKSKVEEKTDKRLELKNKKNKIQEEKIHFPKAKEPIVSNVLKKKHTAHIVHFLDDIKEEDRYKGKKNEEKHEVDFWNLIGSRESIYIRKPKTSELRQEPQEEIFKVDISEEPAEEQKLLEPEEQIEILPETKNEVVEIKDKTQTHKKVKKKLSIDPLVKKSKSACQLTCKNNQIQSDVMKKASSASTLTEATQEIKVEESDVINVEVVEKRDSIPETRDLIEEIRVATSNQVEIEDEQIERRKLISKRSIVQKNHTPDPDLQVFVVPEEPEKPEEPQEEDKFIPLQSNRLSTWMHPFQKPEQFDVCPVEIYATPKTIRKRHYPRPRGRRGQPPPPPPPPPPPVEKSDTEESEESESEESESEGITTGKGGTSTSSNDSGFDSSAPGSPSNRRYVKDCDVNCHKKCEKLMANLCGVNQKLIVEAIASVRKGVSENRDSPTSNPAHNPTFAVDVEALEELQSSTYASYQRSGRITPPATTIPRFRKYTIDDFQFLKVLGKGSFGKVLLAELKNTEYYYAVKCLKKDVVLEDDDVECTLIERKVLALGTKHPYLCHLLCTFQTDSHLFFVMEYLNGGDLMFHIQQSGRFPEARARFYAAEIASGLKFLHSKGIVYRDLKLDNILLDFDGHVRIADFGMCKLQIFLDRMADTFCGTPDYMAPEIIKGLHYNQGVDWWSYGVLLYEMLIGQSPFSGCDEDELFWSICNEKPVFPRFLTVEAHSILGLLLEKDGSKRLGNKYCPEGDIQDQPFFKSINWERLEARQLEAPFKPDLQHPLDTQYFDKTFTVEKAKLTPIDKNIMQSMDQSQFQGFSYTNPNATDK